MIKRQTCGSENEAEAVAAAEGTASGGANSKQDGAICPNCGTVNPISRDFCRKCATELPTLARR